MRSVRSLPATFRSLITLPALNVLAVGLSLAAGTVSVFRHVFGGRSDLTFVLINALPTLVYGMAWAALLRRRETIGRSRIRAGWVASIPLAMANAATACGLTFWHERHTIESFLGGLLAGASFGAILWVPALVVTLVCFGLPIVHAQRLAQKGLAGEERGEIVVGVVSALVAVGALALLSVSRNADHWFGADREPSGYVAIAALAVLGALAGLAAVFVSLRRENERRAFVRAVEAGEVEGYRVDPTDEGKVLVRVTSMGEGYRVGSFVEPVFGLDTEGEAQRRLMLE